MDSPILGFPDNLFFQTVTIASGKAVSEIIATQGRALVGLEMPSGWDAANIGFQSCVSGNVAKLKNLYDNGGNLEQCVVAASYFVLFPSTDAIFAPFLALTSVSAGSTTGVNQSADRVIGLLFRAYLD